MKQQRSLQQEHFSHYATSSLELQKRETNKNCSSPHWWTVERSWENTNTSLDQPRAGSSGVCGGPQNRTTCCRTYLSSAWSSCDGGGTSTLFPFLPVMSGHRNTTWCFSQAQIHSVKSLLWTFNSGVCNLWLWGHMWPFVALIKTNMEIIFYS